MIANNTPLLLEAPVIICNEPHINPDESIHIIGRPILLGQKHNSLSYNEHTKLVFTLISYINHRWNRLYPCPNCMMTLMFLLKLVHRRITCMLWYVYLIWIQYFTAILVLWTIDWDMESVGTVYLHWPVGTWQITDWGFEIS